METFSRKLPKAICGHRVPLCLAFLKSSKMAEDNLGQQKWLSFSGRKGTAGRVRAKPLLSVHTQVV